LLASLREHNVAWMSEAVLAGIPVIRACITSFRTTDEDIHWVVERINDLFSEFYSGTNEDSSMPIAPVQTGAAK